MPETTLPTFSSSKFGWTRGHATAYCSALNIKSFPKSGFYMKSHRTGEVKLFLPDRPNMEANEFYDGEAYTYFVPAGGLTAQIWA